MACLIAARSMKAIEEAALYVFLSFVPLFPTPYGVGGKKRERGHFPQNPETGTCGKNGKDLNPLIGAIGSAALH